jgi:hypothetical protein
LQRILDTILLWCVVVLIGCDGGGIASSKEGKDRITTIEKVSATHWMPENTLSFAAFVSSDGSHVAVKRDVSERLNDHQWNFEVDGNPAPRSYSRIEGPWWSANGKSFVYVGVVDQPKPLPTQYFIVHDANVYGPVGEWRGMAISADGSKTCMATRTIDAVKNVMTHEMILNGVASPIGFEPKEIRFDASNVPLFKHPDEKHWEDASGNTVPEPPDPEATAVAVPTVPVTVALVKGPDKKAPKRAVLTVNGKNIGDYDAVISTNSPKRAKQFGFLQPDGRTFVYVIDGNRLDRLWFRF